MKKPDFLVVGAAKSGTTSLFHYLNAHPHIFIPEIKECRFFSQMSRNQRGLGAEKFQNEGVREASDYFKLFEGQENKICGDISNDYLYFYEKSITNIKKFLGDKVKIIIILRNPINRAYSNYMHHLKDGWEDCSFEEALIKEYYRIKNNWAWPYHYVNVGMYYNQVKTYLENFKNIRIFLFEDLKNRKEFLKEVFEFLEVDFVKIEDENIYNISGMPQSKLIQRLLKEENLIKNIIKPFIPLNLKRKILFKIEKKNLKKIPMKEETRLYLNSIFKDDILKLQDLIQRNLSSWLK